MLHEDPALETLLLPFMEAELSWPSAGTLFLRARDGWPLHVRNWPGLVCAQGFRPAADALQHSGCTLVDAEDATARYPLVLLLPPRQREEARALFARALAQLQPGGTLVACMANNEGAKSGQADLARIAGPLQVRSKHHCRVFWTAPLAAPADPALADAWRTADAPRPILGGFLSRPGVFA